ncbi:MAG: hypothetical protein ACFFCF_04585 [Promethearchaeota archaeon]
MLNIELDKLRQRQLVGTFEFLVILGMLLFGIFLLVGSTFAFTRFIPQNIGGFWSSMDCHQKYTFLSVMLWALGIGVFLITTGSTLLFYFIKQVQKDASYLSRIHRSLSLKIWALFQTLSALLVIAYALIWYFRVTVFGGPYGCSHSHLVPSYFPIAVFLVEIPALILALITYWRPHREFFMGWILIGLFRIILAVIFFFIPWYYLITPFIVMNELTFNIAELLLGFITITWAILLYPTFRCLPTLQGKQWKTRETDH